jgi:hypothetical protein
VEDLINNLEAKNLKVTEDNRQLLLEAAAADNWYSDSSNHFSQTVPLKSEERSYSELA